MWFLSQLYHTYRTCQYKNKSALAEASALCELKLVKLCEVLDCTNHLAGVGVLVVVPRNNLYLVGVVVDLCNHCLS